VIIGAIMSFICGVLNIFNLYLTYWVLLDIIVFIGLGFGILLGRSRSCAIIACVYFLIGKIYVISIANASTIIFSVVFLILLGLGVVGTFRFQANIQKRAANLDQYGKLNRPRIRRNE
jgi:hypothetical protein